VWKRRLQRKPDAGNPHVRFDEGEGDGITAVPSLLYNLRIMKPLPCLTRLSRESAMHPLVFGGSALLSMSLPGRIHLTPP